MQPGHFAEAITPSSGVRQTVSRRDIVSSIAIWAGIAGAMALMAIASGVDHDESQYVAGTALSLIGKPFVDFLHLQTPLQLYLAAPLAALVPYGFLAMRVATAMLGVAIIALTYFGQRSLGVSARAAALCTTLMACCASFHFGFGVMRNDALPALLFASGILAAFLALRTKKLSWIAWGAAALLFGAATSCKISYALLQAGAGFFVLVYWLRREVSFASVIAFAVGSAIGMIPIVLAWHAAPEAFTYGVFTYAMTAPFDNVRMYGDPWKLTLISKIVDSFLFLARGPAFAALILMTIAAVVRLRRGIFVRAEVVFLEFLVVTGFVAMLLPTPTYRQYAIPLLMPLFVLLGTNAEWLRSLKGHAQRAAVALIAIGTVIGAGNYIKIVATPVVTGDWPVLTLTREAHWIGARLRAAGAQGVISSLSPQFALDSGYPLDPRFATGVFAYRTGDRIPEDLRRRLNLVSPSTLAAALDEDPPAAILVGYEGVRDIALRKYAEARGYRSESSPFAATELLIRPQTLPAPAVTGR